MEISVGEDKIEFPLKSIFEFENGEIIQVTKSGEQQLPFILTKHPSLDEIDQSDKNKSTLKTFATSSDQMKAASLSCSELDLLYGKVSKETMTDISFNYLENMSEFENETDHEEIIVEQNYTELEFEQKKELDFAEGSIHNPETNKSIFEKDNMLERTSKIEDLFDQKCSESLAAEFKSNKHESNCTFETEIEDSKSIQLSILETEKETASLLLDHLEDTNLVLKTKAQDSKPIDLNKNLECASDEQPNLIQRSDLCLKTLQEMKSTLIGIMQLLQEEHEEKTESFSKILELIQLLNDLKLKTTEKFQNEYTNEKFEDEKSFKTILHEIEILQSQEALTMPITVLPMDALYKFSKLYHKMLTDLEKSLHINTNEKSEMFHVFENKYQTDDNKTEYINNSCNENHYNCVKELIEEIVEYSMMLSTKTKKSEADTIVSRTSEQNVKSELSEILKKKGIECTTGIKHTVEHRQESNLGVNVKKIISLMEKKSKHAEILNEQEVNEILKYGKDKVEYILHKMPQLTSAEESCQKTELENQQNILENQSHEQTFPYRNSEKDQVDEEEPSEEQKNESLKTNFLYSATNIVFDENESDNREIHIDETQDEDDSEIYDLPLPDPCLLRYNNNDGNTNDLANDEMNQRSGDLKTRSYSETNLTKKELKFSVSSDDLDTDQLLSICVVGDKINVKTSSKAFASSTFDVTSTENGFNFTLKSRSQSHLNVSNVFLEEHVDGVASYGSSILDIERKEETFDTEKEKTTEVQYKEENDDTEANCDCFTSKEELNEEEEKIVLDDNCSVDTVIENKCWKVKKERSDSLLNNYDYADEEEVSSNIDVLPNYLSVSSSCASSDGNEGIAFDLEHLDKLSFCSQGSSEHVEDEIKVDSVDSFDEKQTIARSTMFLPHKELYYAPKVRTKFVATIYHF